MEHLGKFQNFKSSHQNLASSMLGMRYPYRSMEGCITKTNDLHVAAWNVGVVAGPDNFDLQLVIWPNAILKVKFEKVVFYNFAAD